MTRGWIPPDFMFQFWAAAFTSIWTQTLFHISNPPFWLNVWIVSSSNDLELIIMSVCVSFSICLQPWKQGWLRTTHCLFTELWDLISSPSFPPFTLLSFLSFHSPLCILSCPSMLLSHAPFILISNINTFSFCLYHLATGLCFYLIRSSKLLGERRQREAVRQQ